MNIITLIIVGLVAGFLAFKVVKNSFGLLGDLIIGILGAFLGPWIFGQLGIVVVSGLVGTIIAAFVGAVVLLLVIRLFKRR